MKAPPLMFATVLLATVFSTVTTRAEFSSDSVWCSAGRGLRRALFDGESTEGCQEEADAAAAAAAILLIYAT